MFRKQDGRCYLCERQLPADRSKIVIDHDHDCCKPGPSGQSFSCGYCRRGLACDSCNTGISRFGEDPQLLRLVADNLERSQATTKALMMTKPEQRDLLGRRV
jgi:hypothetical protein